MMMQPIHQDDRTKILNWNPSITGSMLDRYDALRSRYFACGGQLQPDEDEEYENLATWIFGYTNERPDFFQRIWFVVRGFFRTLRGG